MPGFSLLSTRTSTLRRLSPWLSALAAGAARGRTDLLSTTVSAGSSGHRECADRAVSGARASSPRQIATPMSGIVSAKLNAGGGDWDLAVFETATGRTVGGSAGLQRASRSHRASSAGPRALTVQACRLSGSAGSAKPRRPRSRRSRPATSASARSS